MPFWKDYVPFPVEPADKEGSNPLRSTEILRIDDACSLYTLIFAIREELLRSREVQIHPKCSSKTMCHLVDEKEDAKGFYLGTRTPD